MQNLVNGFRHQDHMTCDQRHTFRASDFLMMYLFLCCSRSTSALPSVILCAGSGKQQSTKKRAADVDLDAETQEDDSASDYAPAKRQRSIPSPAKRRGKGQKGGRQKRK